MDSDVSISSGSDPVSSDSAVPTEAEDVMCSLAGGSSSSSSSSSSGRGSCGSGARGQAGSGSAQKAVTKDYSRPGTSTGWSNVLNKGWSGLGISTALITPTNPSLATNGVQMLQLTNGQMQVRV